MVAVYGFKLYKLNSYDPIQCLTVLEDRGNLIVNALAMWDFVGSAKTNLKIGGLSPSAD